MSGAPRIRLATVEDAEALGRIHVAAHRFGYAGIAPAEYLDRLSPERRSRSWREFLADPPPALRVWLAEVERAAAGFCGTHEPDSQHDADLPPGTALLHWIHLDPSRVGTGLGRALMAHALDDLRERGNRGVGLWVLDGNARARRFYEIGGWSADGARADRLFRADDLEWPAV